MKAQLTQEAKDALIEALKDYLPNYAGTRYSEQKKGFKHAIDVIESFPVSDGWIPVSDEMPCDMEEVNTYDKGIYRYGSRVPSEERTFQCGSSGIWYVPTHWKYVDAPPTTNN